ncbi:MAG: hypothetical protein HZB43_08995 [candidate division Zixibacteria bacterium]|nr:hypothetical protein [candidate division Zixibacteria bacterium]
MPQVDDSLQVADPRQVVYPVHVAEAVQDGADPQVAVPVHVAKPGHVLDD